MSDRPQEMFGDEVRAEIEETILDIVELEEPVHLARVIRRTAISRGQSPADALAARAIQGVLRELVGDAVAIDDDGFIVFLDIDAHNPAPSPAPRVPSDDSETQRPVVEVPSNELTMAAQNLLSDAPATRRALVVQVAELYRWDATSADLAARLDDLLDLLINSGELLEDAGQLVAAGDRLDDPLASTAEEARA